MNDKANEYLFGRETWVKVPVTPKIEREAVFAACLKTDDEKLLIPGKIYKIKLGGNRACVTDEEGEVAIYPMDFFLILSLTPTAESALAEIVG